jgi:Trk K+ transport system NAD-binding subunit
VSGPDPRRVLLLGTGDLAAETYAALKEAAGAPVTHLEDPTEEGLREALEEGVDAVAIIARDDAWPVRVALLVRHLDDAVPMVATVFDSEVGEQLERVVGNCKVTSLAQIVAPSLAGPCVDPDFAAVFHGKQPVAMRVAGDEVEEVPLPEQRPRKLRALTTALLQPYERNGRLVLFGAMGLVLVLLIETVGAMIALDQKPIDALYASIKTLVTVGPNSDVEKGPSWFKAVISVTMILALLCAACFTGGLVERLINRRLTGLVGRRAVPRREHVVVVGLGQVGIRLCLLLRRCGFTVVAIDPREDGVNVGHARELGLPVIIGRGADPSVLKRLRPDEAHALAAVTSDDLENLAVAVAGLAQAQDLRIVLRAGSHSVGGETRSVGRIGQVRDVNRIAAAYLAGVTLGSEAESVVVVGDEPRLRHADGRLEPFPFSVMA